MATAEARLRGAGLTNISAVHMHGGIVETIIEREAEAGLVVMGKRGASSDFVAGHLGSKIERALRASNKPLLVAPTRYTSPALAVIAYDGGQSVARAIELLTRTSLLDGLPVHLVRAGAETQEHRAEMERAVQMFEQSGRAATCSLTQGIDHAATDFASIFKKPKSRTIQADRISVIAFGLALIGTAALGRKRSMLDARFRPTAALCAVREYRSKAEAIGG